MRENASNSGQCSNINSAREFVDESLSIAMHAMRAGVHTTLGSNSIQQRHVSKHPFNC